MRRIWVAIAMGLGVLGLTASAPALAQDTTPPPVVDPTYPPQGDVVQNPRVGFTWSAVTDPSGVTYRLEVSSVSNFSSTVMSRPGLTTSSYDLAANEPLTRNSLYYWRVYAIDGANNTSVSPIRSFTVGARPIAYNLEIARDAAFAIMAVRKPGLTTNAYDLTVAEQLDQNVTYYWRVQSYDPAGNTRLSNSAFTLSIADRFPPPAPSPVYPQPGAALINPRVYFDWTDSTDLNGVVYRLQVATDSTFASVVLDRAGLTASNYASAAGEALVRGTRYYWRIGVTDSRNNTAFGPGWLFTVDTKTSKYRLQVSTDSAFAATVLNRDGLEFTELQTPISEQFREAVQYYWRVIASDAAGNTTTSNAAFRFRLNDTFAPTLPALLYPLDGHVILNPRVAFDWSDSSDSSTPVRYRIQVATDSTFSGIAVDSGSATLLTTSSYTLPAGTNLVRGTRYYWRVQAVDGSGNGAWTPASDFSLSEKTVNYTYELARASTFANLDLRKPALAANEYTLAQTEALTEGVQYWWRVVATDLAGNITISAAAFRVSLVDVYAPALPVLLYPAAESSVLNPVQAFDWSDSTDRGSSTGVTYRLQVASDSAFNAVVRDVSGLTASQHQLTAAQALTRGVRYFWRVQARDSIGNAQFTPGQAFTVSPKTVNYRLEVARDSGFAQIHMSRSDLGTTSYDTNVIEQLSEGVRYYWRVRALDLAGNPTTSPTFSLQLADQFAPSIPVPIYPPPGAEVLNPRIAFDWSDSTDPNGVSYRFQLASDATFGAPLVDQTALVTSSYTLAANQALAPGGQYFWRIGVLDGRGNSAFGPAIMVRVNARAVSYTLEVARDTAFNVIHVVRSAIVQREYTLMGVAEQLTEGVRYYWRVRARDLAGNERVSTSVFSLQLNDIFAPTLPDLIYPLADASMINPRIAFDWTDAMDPNGVQYRLQIASDATFTNLVLERTGFQLSSYTLAAAEVLQRGQRYWWRVGVSDNNGNTAFTPGRAFIVRGKEVLYRLEIARDSGFSTLQLARSGIDQPSFQLGVAEQLSDGVQYWWRVRATDLAGNERISTAAFTLRLADTYPPPLPVAVYPVPDGTVINPRPAFEWSDVTDGNGVTYRLQVSTDSQFSATLVDLQNLTASQASLPAATTLVRGNRYFWRVGVRDTLGNSAFTGAFVFTVQPKTVVYRFEISRDQAFTQIHSNRSGLTSPEYILTPNEQLTEGVRYWWRVRATDLAGLDRDSTSVFSLQLADNFPPPLPVPLYPPPGERVYNPRIAFNWSDVADPNGVFYRFQISNDSTFTNLVAQSAGDLTTSQYALTATQALARGNRYYWRVVVRDSRGNAQATAPFELRVGVKEVQYRVEIGTDQAFGVLHTMRAGLDTAEWTLPRTEELVEGRPYWWRVRATDLASNERISTATFRLQLADVFAPALPTLSYPPNDSVVLNPNPGFDWSDTTDPNGVRYTIQVASDPFFQSLVINRNQLVTSQYQAAPAEVLVRGQQYYWRVGVTDTINNTAWTAPFLVRVRPKEVFYRLDVARDAAFTTMHTSRSQLTANEYQLLAAEELSEGVTYYWRVNATDLASNQRTSGTFRLSLADVFPPSLPEPIYPPIGASVINPVVGFDWTDSNDSNGVVYRLQVAQDTMFSQLRVDRVGLSVSRFQLAAADALAPGQYYWRIGVADSRNNGAFSRAFPFEVRRKQIEYRLEVATNAAFTAVPLARAGLTTTEYQVLPSEELSEGTQYYWHVRARDPAGNERVSTADFRFAMADVFPPSIPTYLYPQANALMINRSVSFDWTDSRDSNGVVYRLQVSTTADFMNLAVDQQGLTTSQWQMPANVQLARGQRYFWRVVVTDNRGNSANGPSQAFNVRNKEVTYRLDVARDTAFQQLHTWNQGLATTEYTLAQSERLNDNVRYYWRVTAMDLAGNTQGSTGFFSLQLRDIYPPDPAVLQYPPPFAQVLNPRIGFDWSDVVDSAGSGVRYQLQVATDAAFNTIVLDRPGLTASGYQLAAGEDLTRGQRYYWRVGVSDTLGNRAMGSAIELTVLPKVVQYRFEVATDAAFTQVHTVQAFLQTNEYTLSELEKLRENQLYYWRVTASDLSGNTRAATQTWRVRLSDVYPPDLPTRTYPAANAALVNPVASFDWTDSTDPSGVRYILQVATDSSMGALVIDRNDLTASSFTVPAASPLRRGQRYWWRVGTVDTVGNTARTSTQSFTIQSKDVVYTLEIATDTGFQTMFLTVPDLLTPGYELDVTEEVDLGVQYYWRVRAVDVANNIRVSDPFRFTVSLPSFTRSIVTPLPQPERADYQFLVTGMPNWTLDLFRRVNGQCADLIYRRTAMMAGGMNGTWAGLSPGADYCWSVAASDSRGSVSGAGTFSMNALGTFTSTPAATPTGLDVDLAADFSVAANGAAQYRDGDCTGVPTSLLFDGSDVVFAPGPIVTRGTFTLEAWIRPTMTAQTRTIFSSLNGNVRLGLSNGNLRLTVVNGQGTIAQDSAIAVPVNAWSHVAGVYANGIMRVLIDGVNRGQRTATGDVNPIPNGSSDSAMLGGFANTGFIGEIASFSVYDNQVADTVLGAHYTAGASTELPAEPGRRAAWRFAEAAGVQSAYDASGNHRAAVLGLDNSAEMSDPVRLPSFNYTANMGTATQSFATRLTMMTGGPTYCWRVVADTARGLVASSPLRSFRRNTDTQPPVVVADPIFVAECQGSSSATVSAPRPMVTDNLDPNPTVVSRLASRTGVRITMPYRFTLGDTQVWWVATDNVGNEGADDTVVRIRDTTRPSVTGGPEIVLEASAPAGTPYTPQPQSATDACTSVTITHNGPAAYPLGVTAVTFTVRDTSGNESTAPRNVRVIDTTAPSFAPPLANLTVGHDSSTCFRFTPPSPSVSDNGYPASQIEVTGRKLSGPGNNGCWDVGTHTYEWTLRDASGNTRTGVQTIVVTSSTLVVGVRGLEVRGMTAPAGRYHNAPVTVIFEVSGGAGAYMVTVVPPPASVTQMGTTWRATYSAQGAYPSIVITARDGGGTGSNYGSAVFGAFGVDTTPPVIEAEIISQAGVNLADQNTYPRLYFGETLPLEAIVARDAAVEKAALGRARMFDGNDIIAVPHSATLAVLDAVTLEAWVRIGAGQDAAIISKAAGGGSAYGMHLGVTAAGAARFELRLDGQQRSVVGGRLTPRVWHHVAGTYDGRAMRLWVDGLPAEYRIASGRIDSGAGAMTIGGALESGALSRRLDGEIAEPAVWRTALAEQVVLLHWRGGVGRQVVPNASAAAVYHLIGAGQSVIDASGNSNNGTLGMTAAFEADDPMGVDLAHPQDPTSSGMVSMAVTIQRADMAVSSPLISTSSMAQGIPLAIGERMVGGRLCNAPVGAVCNRGDALLKADLISSWDGMREGAYHLVVRAEDAAGNVTMRQIAFRTRSYVGALADVIAGIDALIAAGNFQALTELNDARGAFSAARSYAMMQTPYMDGSFLRADQGIDFLYDADVLNAQVGTLPEQAGRGMLGAIGSYIDGLGAGLHPSDRRMHADGQTYVLDARFERYSTRSLRFGQTALLSRQGLDTVALLYPAYQPVRQQLRRVQDRWSQQLDSLSRGETSMVAIATDPFMRILDQGLVSASRDLIRDVLYREMSAALENPNTTERRAMTELLDVMDKSEVRPDEAGDLVSISNRQITDACLDVLTLLQLPDDAFTRCYLRLNDSARFLDTVQEPLVATYRWRAGLGLVLFNMLELSLNASPTGLPWVTAPVPYPPAYSLVLPDARAATIAGTRSITSVDQPDMVLRRAYERYGTARAAFDAGDVNRAWSIFVDERCLLLNTYNRYYSTNNQTPNVADPKEAPIDPNAVGCAQ